MPITLLPNGLLDSDHHFGLVYSLPLEVLILAAVGYWLMERTRNRERCTTRECVVGLAADGFGTLSIVLWFAYPATPGYDLATGLGSVDLYVLASNWALYQAAGSTTKLRVSTTTPTAAQNVTFTTKTTASAGNPQNATVILTYRNPTNPLYENMNGSNGIPPSTDQAKTRILRWVAGRTIR